VVCDVCVSHTAPLLLLISIASQCTQHTVTLNTHYSIHTIHSNAQYTRFVCIERYCVLCVLRSVYSALLCIVSLLRVWGGFCVVCDVCVSHTAPLLLCTLHIHMTHETPTHDTVCSFGAVGCCEWLQLVSSLKLYVSFAEYRLFYRALLQKRRIILRSPLCCEEAQGRCCEELRFQLSKLCTPLIIAKKMLLRGGDLRQILWPNTFLNLCVP